MKMNTKIALVLGVAAMTVMSAVAAPHGAGTDTLHFGIKTALTDTGVEPGSAGTVSANEIRNHGVISNQKLDVTVSGLTSNTTYSVVATTGSGTTDLASLTTDNNGRGAVHLHTAGRGGGTNSSSFPDGFELAQVTELDVANGSSQNVLTTSGNTPTSV